jgi:DnaJ family protein A protein 2
VITEIPHPVFRRRGHDLIVSLTIPLIEALTSSASTITHLDGTKLVLMTDDIIKPEEVRMVPNMGMPHPSNPQRRGQLYLQYQVEFPASLNDKAKKKLESVLPGRRPLSYGKKDVYTELNPIKIPDAPNFQEDEGEDQPQPEGVQCAHQ